MRASSATASSIESPIPIARASRYRRRYGRLKERGLTLFTGIEPEFMLLSAPRRREALGPADPRMTSTSLAMTTRACTERARRWMRWWPGFGPSGSTCTRSITRMANGQFEINFTYADALKSADNISLS